MEKGLFVISIDFEMLWGAIFNESVEEGYRFRVPYVEKIIPRLISLFDKYKIHATWAVVAGIACEDKQMAVSFASEKIENPYHQVSLKQFIDSIPESDEEFYFRPDLIHMINTCEGQEIATHTFSHFYFLEHKEAILKLKEEIRTSKTILEDLTHGSVETMILPKNQVTDEVFQVMRDTGIRIVRNCQISKRFNMEENLVRKILRFLDAYIPVCGKASYRLEETSHDGIIDIRASRFWRTYDRRLGFLEGLKFLRIKHEITYAAKHGEVYHLWFHPHNLSKDYERNLKFLDKIMKHYEKMNKQYGMRSVNMRECADV